MNNPVEPGPRRSPLAAGIVLIVLGALLLALNLGWDIPFALWDFWPVFLIVPGIVALISPTRHLSRSGGLWLVATGLYCQIASSDWLGLGWFTAWPIFVIAYGVDIIVGRDAQRAAPHTEEQVSHER
jgi:hypothetical protein